MTTAVQRVRGAGGGDAPNPHVRRFLASCEHLVRAWVWCLGIALALAAVGAFPSLFAMAGALGLAWVPLIVLILWGRLLDDTGFRPRDAGGCR